MDRAVRIRVTGRVQGVWYRGWTEAEAKARGLAGWIRNCRDGSVEAVMHGPAADVAAMLDAMRRGPPAARVDTLEVEDLAEPGPLPGFEIRD